MPSRFEYIQSNFKSNAQQKTVSGICARAELTPTPINNWVNLSTLVPGFLNLRVWKDAAGTVRIAGGLSVGATPPVAVNSVIDVAVLPPGYRPSGSLPVPGFYWDQSALAFVQASIIIQANGTIQLFTGVTAANGDYFAVNGGWVGV